MLLYWLVIVHFMPVVLYLLRLHLLEGMSEVGSVMGRSSDSMMGVAPVVDGAVVGGRGADGVDGDMDQGNRGAMVVVQGAVQDRGMHSLQIMSMADCMELASKSCHKVILKLALVFSNGVATCPRVLVAPSMVFVSCGEQYQYTDARILEMYVSPHGD